MRATTKSPVEIISAALSGMREILASVAWNACGHECFVASRNSDGPSELALCVCSDCGHRWLIAGAEHCEPSSLPGQKNLAPNVAFDPARQVSSGQNVPGPASPSPMCGEVVES